MDEYEGLTSSNRIAALAAAHAPIVKMPALAGYRRHSGHFSRPSASATTMAGKAGNMYRPCGCMNCVLIRNTTR